MKSSNTEHKTAVIPFAVLHRTLSFFLAAAGSAEINRNSAGVILLPLLLLLLLLLLLGDTIDFSVVRLYGLGATQLLTAFESCSLLLMLFVSM